MFAIDLDALLNYDRRNLLTDNHSETGTPMTMEARFSALLEASSDIIHATRADGSFLFVNCTWHQRLGYPDISKITLLDIVKGSHRQSLLKCLEELAKTESSQPLKAVLCAADGTEIEVEGTMTLSLEGESQDKVFFAILRDISQLKESERAMKEFYSLVSHELRSPLASVRGALGLVEGGMAGEVSAEALELIEIARSSCDRLIDLINDILDLRKLEFGEVSLNQTEVEVDFLVGTALSEFSSVSEVASVQVHTEFDTNLEPSILVHCDPDRIVQALNNLLTNALRFSPRQSTISLQVSKSAPDLLRFSVIDRGPTIAESFQSKVFMKFQQLESSEGQGVEGSGLGLAIAKAIVEHHGGSIGVSPAKDGGNTFWFELKI